MRFATSFTVTVALFTAFEIGKKVGAGRLWSRMTDLWDSVAQ